MARPTFDNMSGLAGVRKKIILKISNTFSSKKKILKNEHFLFEKKFFEIFEHLRSAYSCIPCRFFQSFRLAEPVTEAGAATHGLKRRFILHAMGLLFKVVCSAVPRTNKGSIIFPSNLSHSQSRPFNHACI